MEKAKGSKKESLEREKWNKIFNALIHMVQTQQTQLESLGKDRKLLEDRIKLQYERWVSDVNLFQDQIFQMKRGFTAEQMEHIVEAAKTDFLMGLKLREAFVYKNKLENADSELADLRDYLSHKCSEQKDITVSTNSKSEEHQYHKLECELRRLKCENDKLILHKSSEITALLAEKDFVWNQYKKMEGDLNEQLKQKHAEVKSANEKIQRLLARMEELQSSNTEKHNMIVTLKTDMTKLKSDSFKKDGEVSRLSRELEMLRKSRNDSATPLLRHCTTESGRSRLKGKKRGTDGRITVKKESDSLHGLGKGSKSSKRKAVDDTIYISDSPPKLFTSSFRVPKLKNSSPAL